MAKDSQGNRSSFREKRELPRLLCTPAFSSSLVYVEGKEFDVSSINFNRNGLGIFMNGRLPDAASGTVSFQFETADGQQIRITDLPFLLVYANETEVGSQYGLKFETGEVMEDVLQALREIESGLSLQAADNRYDL
ncbi:hypothetical protein [Hahella ganghwensis]|uniref:hypothetical protein n=1 Tax=Hahella ganghwensis TaxID=286420 RepID=UPI0003795954|nr:hypothetical protein [Hahella ganghwensis]